MSLSKLEIIRVEDITVNNIIDLTATAAEINLLDLESLTEGWVLSADGPTSASWKQLNISDINNDLNFLTGITVDLDDVEIGITPKINFIGGDFITITAVENLENNSIDLTFYSTGETEFKSLTLESPTNSEDLTLFKAPFDINITKMVMVLRGSSPSVSWTLKYDTDRSTTGGTEVITGGTTSTNTTVGQTINSFDNSTIPQNNFIWLETTNTSGTIDELNLTISYIKT